MRCNLFDVWVTRGRHQFLLLRHATHLHRELFEVLDISNYAYLARLHGGFSITETILMDQYFVANDGVMVSKTGLGFSAVVLGF